MPTTAPFDIGSFIDSDPNCHDGWPYVRGTRKTVASVGLMYAEGLTAEEIAEEKSMTPLQVYAALTYYLANREEIDRTVEGYEREAGERARNWPTTRRAWCLRRFTSVTTLRLAGAEGLSTPYPRGSPRPRVATMPRCTSLVPPAIVALTACM